MVNIFLLSTIFFYCRNLIVRFPVRELQSAVHDILVVWRDDQLGIFSMSVQGVVFQVVHSKILSELREGRSIEAYLEFYASIFKQYFSLQQNMHIKFFRFYSHIFVYSMGYIYSSQKIGFEGNTYLHLSLVCFAFLFKLLLPQSIILDPKVFSVAEFQSGWAEENEFMSFYAHARGDDTVERDLESYKKQVEKFCVYLPILEILYVGPLLLIFCNYLFETGQNFSIV